MIQKAKSQDNGMICSCKLSLHIVMIENFTLASKIHNIVQMHTYMSGIYTA